LGAVDFKAEAAGVDAAAAALGSDAGTGLGEVAFDAEDGGVEAAAAVPSGAATDLGVAVFGAELAAGEVAGGVLGSTEGSGLAAAAAGGPAL
jgi:hypothetical protein